MPPPQSLGQDFKSIGSKLLRSQPREPSSTSSNSSESIFLRRIDYSGDSNTIQSNTNNRLDQESQKFEFMIDTVILADRALKDVRGSYTKCIGVKLRWRFMDKDASTRIVQVCGNEIPIGELYTYSIPINDSTFFNERIIHFDVFAIYPGKEKLVGFSEFNLCDCAENLDVHLGKCLDLFCVGKRKCCSGSKMRNVGRLLIQYKLNKNCENKISQIRVRTYPNLVNIQNEEIKNDGEIKLDCNDDNQEYLFDLFPISSNLNHFDLKSTSSSVPNIPIKFLYQTPITIIINSLRFNENFGQNLKPNMTYYIEYSFLDRKGLETLNFPLSSDYSTIFNSMITFKFDIKRNIKDYRAISKMITTNKFIKFIVVEEPRVDLNKIPVCFELAYSNVYLSEINSKKSKNEYPLFSMKNPHEKIGYLNVEIIGLKNVIDFIEKRQILGITQEKSKSLDSFNRLEDKEKVEIEIGVKPNEEIHQDFIKKIEGNSLKLTNTLKVTRGDLMMNLNGHNRKSMNTKRKNVERNRLNRRLIKLIGNDFKKNVGEIKKIEEIKGNM